MFAFQCDYIYRCEIHIPDFGWNKTWFAFLSLSLFTILLFDLGTMKKVSENIRDIIFEWNGKGLSLWIAVVTASTSIVYWMLLTHILPSGRDLCRISLIVMRCARGWIHFYFLFHSEMEMAMWYSYDSL